MATNRKGLFMRKIVLVVEDEPILAMGYKEELEEWGYEVRLARDGVNAVDLFEDTTSGHFFSFISDMRMPRMSGIELCQALDRSNNKVPPVLIHSSDGQYHHDTNTFEIKKLREWFQFVKEVHLKSHDYTYLKTFLESIS